MADVIPFIGLRYNQNKISNLASVMTPPYDVINEKAQARYYAENPANIIRLELGLVFPDDDDKSNRYSRAKKYLDKWLEDESMLPESKPALYIYQQEFHDNQGRIVIRNGFICGLKVEEYAQGNILPHEETLSKPKTDRLKLMHATQSNFSSIFGLYSDPEKLVDNTLAQTIANHPPDMEITDEAQEIHRIWVVTDEEAISKVQEVIKAKQIFIADGHHRYETALQYSKDMKEEEGQTGYDYVLTTLVNLYDEGLVVFPTHRVVKGVRKFDIAKLKTTLEELFDIEEYGSSDNLSEFMEELNRRGNKKHVFGLYTPEKTLYFLSVKNMNQAKSRLSKEKSEAWKKLDVALLDNLVLADALGIDESNRKNQDSLSYTRDEAWAIAEVDKGSHQLALLLNPTRVEEVVAVAKAGDKMPQKSTYFYPKLMTGVVINPLFLNL